MANQFVSNKSPIPEKNNPSFKGFLKINSRQLLLLLILLVVCILPYFGKSSSINDYPTKNEVAKREIIADFAFDVYKHPDSLEKEKLEVLKNVPVLLEFKKEIGIDQISRFDSIFTSSLEIIADNKLKTEEKAKNLSIAFSSEVSNSDIDFLQKLRKPNDIKNVIKTELEHIYAQGFYSVDSLEGKKESYYFSIKRIKKETPYTKELVLTEKDAKELLQIEIMKKFLSYTDKGEIALKLSTDFLKPNLIPNWDTTNIRREKQLSTVKKEKDKVMKHERIIGLHEKVTPEIELKLRSLTLALTEGEGVKDIAKVKRFIGWLSINLIIVFLLAMYFYKFHYNIWKNKRDFNLFIALIILCIFIGQLLLMFKFSLLLLPISFIAVLFSIFLPLDIVLAGIIFVSLAVSINFKQDIYTFAAILTPGVVIATTLPDLIQRKQMYKPILFAIIATALVVLGSDFSQDVFFTQVSDRIMLCSLGILLSAVFALFLINPIEHIVKTTSHFTLNDFAHTNHQLIKQLSVEGPGTYHHSINIATLAENAASEIGADQILCRVGGFFHDIGKLTRPEYFNENDPPESMHKHLSPMESASILVSHVKEGIDIARSNHLPEPIVDIIRQHHGTTIMRYFYEKALALDSTFTEDNFRYAGPKPQTKEAAIIMIADICEAGVRSLNEKTHETISELVEKFTDIRLADGQFDGANITMSEIRKVKNSLIKDLLGIHHQRNRDDSVSL